MGPDDVELARVYTADTGSSVSDLTFKSGTGFDVVVEAEAGNAAAGSGQPWDISIVVRDLHQSHPPTYTDSANGSLGVAPWSSQKYTHRFAIPAQPTAKQGHAMEVLAVLTIRVADPDVSFAKSLMFCITKP